MNGQILGVDRDGVFAEYAVIPESVAWVNDRAIPPEMLQFRNHSVMLLMLFLVRITIYMVKGLRFLVMVLQLYSLLVLPNLQEHQKFPYWCF